MPKEYSLLDQLGVQVPTAAATAPAMLGSAGRVRRADPTDAHSLVMAPVEKPPPPTRAQHTSLQRARVVAPAQAPAKAGAPPPVCVPTDEVRVEQRGAETIEYQIWNSNVPSNWAYNAKVAETHAKQRAAERSHREVESAGGFIGGSDVGETVVDQTTRRQLLDAQTRDLEARHAAKKTEQARERQLEREEVARRAVAERESEQTELEGRRRQQREFAAAQARLVEEARLAKQQQRVAERGRKDQNIGLGIGGGASIEQQRLLRAKADEGALANTWQQQMTERKQRERQEKEYAQRLSAEAVAVARDDEERSLRGRAAEREAALAAQKAFLLRKEQDAIATHNQKAAERRAVLQEDQLRAQQAAEDAQRQAAQREAFRSSIQKQLTEKHVHQSVQRQKERELEAKERDLGSDGVRHEVLLRCPVTKRLLPPSHFNIPPNQWPTSTVVAHPSPAMPSGRRVP